MDQRILIAQLNIEHLRQKLATEHDVAKRRIIGRLLAEQEVKLAALRTPELVLGRFLDEIVRQATGLFDHDRTEHELRGIEARLTAVLDRMPVAVGLMDGAGRWIMANMAMRRFAPMQIPSRDVQRMQRWRAFDNEGRLLSPPNWPGARALRGETVNPGIGFAYTADDGRQIMTRISAVPVRYPDGDVAGAIVVIEELAIPARNGTC